MKVEKYMLVLDASTGTVTGGSGCLLLVLVVVVVANRFNNKKDTSAGCGSMKYRRSE
jgi:hypothetical protein